MISIRVLNLESNSEANVVALLEDEFLIDRKFARFAVRTAGRDVLRKCHQNAKLLEDRFTKVVSNYLMQEDYLVLVVNPERYSRLVEHMRRIVKATDFSGRVFFAPDIQTGDLTTSPEWHHIVSLFRAELEEKDRQFQEKWEKWEKSLARFQEGLPDIPEEELIRDINEAIAEVRRERS